MDEMIATLMGMFPWLSNNQALSQILKMCGQLLREMVFHSSIDHFLQHGSHELIQDEGKDGLGVEGVESSV